MSSLHRNVLLESESACLGCGTEVVLPADYCPRCNFRREAKRIVMGKLS